MFWTCYLVNKSRMMKIPAIVPNDNEGVESGEDDNSEPHPKFEPGIIYESIPARDARLEAEKNGQPIVEGAKYSLYPKMSRSRRETLTDLLNADKAAKSGNVDMADSATIDMTDVENISEAKAVDVKSEV